ncbi:MAG: zinc-ribbon domain-containing protein [Oscillospiraceae bacterium]
MKYCAHCGAQLVDEAVVCPKCGCAVAPTKPLTRTPARNRA